MRAWSTVRVFAGTLVFAFVTASTSITAAAPPQKKVTLAQTETSVAVPSLRKGLVVVALGEGAPAADAAWPVAVAIYGDAALRPKLVDRDARVLAGASPASDAPKATVELADLRAKVHGDDVASRALLGEIARRTGARGLVLVTAATATTAAQAQLYDAADDRVEPTLFRADPAAKSGGPWSSLVSSMHARFAPDAPSSSVATGEVPKAPEEGRSSFASSPWFWGALGAAVVAGIVVYAATRDTGQGESPPVRIEWGK
jgi:hypothetical protein